MSLFLPPDVLCQILWGSFRWRQNRFWCKSQTVCPVWLRSWKLVQQFTQRSHVLDDHGQHWWSKMWLCPKLQDLLHERAPNLFAPSTTEEGLCLQVMLKEDGSVITRAAYHWISRSAQNERFLFVPMEDARLSLHQYLHMKLVLLTDFLH